MNVCDVYSLPSSKTTNDDRDASYKVMINFGIPRFKRIANDIIYLANIAVETAVQPLPS